MAKDTVVGKGNKAPMAGRGGISTGKPALPAAAPEAPKKHIPTKPAINAGTIEYTPEDSASILEKLMVAAEAAVPKVVGSGPQPKKRVFRNILGEFMPAIKIFRAKNIPLKDIHENLKAVGLLINFAGFSKALKKYEAAEALEKAKAEAEEAERLEGEGHEPSTAAAGEHGEEGAGDETKNTEEPQI